MRGQGRFLVGCMVAFGLLVLLGACSRGSARAILDLVPLQKQLVAEYGVSNIVIGLQDGDTLEVTVVDGVSSDLARTRKTEQAREIAEFVCQHYASMDRVDRVWVALELREEGFLADTIGSATFAFERGELECGDSG